MLSESNLLATIRKLAISHVKIGHLLEDSLASTAMTNWLYYMLVQRTGAVKSKVYMYEKHRCSFACSQQSLHWVRGR